MSFRCNNEERGREGREGTKTRAKKAPSVRLAD